MGWLTAVDEIAAAARAALDDALGLGERRAQGAGAVETAGQVQHGAGREGGQRVEAGLVLAVQRDIATGGQMVGREEAADAGIEGLAHPLQPFLPVAAAQHHQEVIAADVADEIDLRVGRLGQHPRREPDDVVTDAVAVDIVEGLEMVDVPDHRGKGLALLDQPFQVVVDRHIAGQQRQRIGIARGMHLQVRHGLQQIGTAPRAEVGAVAGDDEAVGQQPLIQVGERVAHRTQRRGHVEHQRVGVHQLDAAVLVEDVHEIALGAALHHMQGAQHADRALGRVQHRQRQQLVIEPEQVDHGLDADLRRHRVAAPGQLGGRRDRALGDRQCLVVLQQARLGIGGESAAPLGAQLRARRGAGPREQIALADRHAQAAQHGQVGLLLQTLGDDLAAAGGGHLDDGAHELLLERLLRNAVDEMAVDLDEVRPHLHPAPQRREAFAEVVQRDPEAMRAQRLQRAVEAGQIVDRSGFGQFDDHARGRQAQHIQLRGQAAGMLTRRQQGVGGDIEEELTRQAQRLEALGRAPHDEAFQLDEAALAGGGLEQHQRRMQRAVGRAAGEGFETEDVRPVDGDQRLKMDVKRLLVDQACQRIGQRIVCALAHGVGGSASGRARVGWTSRNDILRSLRDIPVTVGVCVGVRANLSQLSPAHRPRRCIARAAGPAIRPG
mmetsp:Transcript_100824/g.280899  ORF Transcript_100824/g.280899 Transcript_100824/m.280899 type:complete len:665 (-) Transcript_100824:355-2349(-)